jgi:hypothetical protein
MDAAFAFAPACSAVAGIVAAVGKAMDDKIFMTILS